METKQLKIIFLDVDGVLNNEKTEDKIGAFIGLNDILVKRLKKIVDATGAEIYLISTWKERWYKENDKKKYQDAFADRLDAVFCNYGLKIVDKLEDEDINPVARGRLVKEFLKTANADSFVILDDYEFDYYYENLGDNLVQTNGRYGLTEKDVKKAIEILNK